MSSGSIWHTAAVCGQASRRVSAESFAINGSIRRSISRQFDHIIRRNFRDLRVRLMPGVDLGAYEVLRLIGAGGMGEVYEARDRRRDRIVAVKVLPRESAVDSGRRERFESEARAVDALNQTQSLTVLDIGESASAVLPVHRVRHRRV